MKRRARKVAAMTAEIDMFISSALSEPASFDMIINSVALTAIAVQSAAGAAIKATRPVLGLFHDKTLFMLVDYLLVASQRIEGCSISW